MSLSSVHVSMVLWQICGYISGFSIKMFPVELCGQRHPFCTFWVDYIPYIIVESVIWFIFDDEHPGISCIDCSIEEIKTFIHHFVLLFQDCGPLFGNLFWLQFECQNTNSFGRNMRIETTNMQHVLVLMWTGQFFQNPTFRSSYFSRRQKSYITKLRST